MRAAISFQTFELKLSQFFSQCSKASIYRHAKKSLNSKPVLHKSTINKSRVKKIAAQNTRGLLHTIVRGRPTDLFNTGSLIQN